MLRMFFLFSALSLFGLGRSATYDCTTTQDGVFFDYNPLKMAGSFYRANDATGQTYEFNMCGVIADGGTCQSMQGACCQIDNNGETVVVATASGDGAWVPPVYQIMDSANVNGGLQLYFDNEPSQPGKECFPQGITRRLTVKLGCVGGAPVPTTPLQVSEVSTCNYELPLNTMYGCAAPDGGWDIDGGSSGLSGGSILLIILFPGFFVYLLAGCVYKSKTQGTTGLESTPNIDFWRELPGLVKEGIAFTMGGCKKGGGSGDSGYDEL